MKNFLQTLVAGAALAMMATPAMAGELYLVGEPQNWDINQSNMILDETSTPGIYQGDFDIAEGDFMFRFYTELGDWETNSIGIQEADDPVTITFNDGVYVGHCVAGKGSWNDPTWAGGHIYLTVDLNAMTVVFTDDPDKLIPEIMPDMYIVGASINGNSNWDANAAGKMTYDYENSYYTWSGTSLGSGFKFNDGSWSGDYNIGSNGSPLVEGVAYKYYNGGDSGNITLSSDATVINNPKVVLDLKAGTVTVTGQTEEKEVTVTLAGTFNDWNPNDPAYMLDKVNANNFEGTFYIPEGASFQVVVLGSTWYGNPEGLGEIELDSYNGVIRTLTRGYQNDFVMASSWKGGDVEFFVNLYQMSVSMSGKSSGVESIESTLEGEKVFYNLQGVRVDNPTKGLYIVNGKKVVVK